MEYVFLTLSWLSLGYIAYLIDNAHLRHKYTLAFSEEVNNYKSNLFMMLLMTVYGAVSAVILIIHMITGRMYYAGFNERLGPEPPEIIDKAEKKIISEILKTKSE